MKEIKLKQNIVVFPGEPEQKQTTQSFTIDSDDRWVTITHDYQELSMSLRNFLDLMSIIESGVVKYEEEIQVLQGCESCEKEFDIDIMETDSDSNYFCPECWEVLAPVMKQEYEELVKKGEIDPED